jgi:2,3,4,5-tetrahydropyridine-2-carboxylate N-succinyltransferase
MDNVRDLKTTSITADLKARIETYFEKNENSTEAEEVLGCVRRVIEMLNRGEVRILNTEDSSLNLWVKKAILLLFRYSVSSPQEFDAYDKVGLLEYDMVARRYRKVPGAIIRNGVYIGDGCVIMPSYINIGTYVGDRTMIDINASIGSCAQIGRNCHVSAGCCIGGVLEPVAEAPVIVEDDCFIGGNSAVLEGVIVRKGAVIAPGTTISASTKIIDRRTGNVMSPGVIPEGAVAVQGSYPSDNCININCVVIVKYLSERHNKVLLNEVLREI